MQVEEFIERPAQASAPVAPKAQPTPGSLRPIAQIEADLAELERRTDEAAAVADRLEQEQGSSYQALLAGRGDDDKVAKAGQARSAVRVLMIACDAARADLVAAKLHFERDKFMAWRTEFVKRVEEREALGKEIAAKLAAFYKDVRRIKAIQKTMVSMMNDGKKMVPQGQRKAVLAFESMTMFADETQLGTWVSRDARKNSCLLWPDDEDGMAVSFSESIEVTGRQVVAEMDYILNIGELAAD